MAEVASKSDAAGEAARGEAFPRTPAGEVAQAAFDKVSSKVARWKDIAGDGRTIFGFGGQASRMVRRTLASFDKQAQARGLDLEGADCTAARTALRGTLQRRIHAVFLAQRALVEQVVYQRFKNDLLRRMRRKKSMLEVKERARLLRGAMKEYDSRVREVLPSFVPEGSAERSLAEQRLGELAVRLEEQPEVKEMLQQWKIEKLRQSSQQKQERQFSLSLSPGLRVMLRPGGTGNMQLLTRRQVGPPHNPNEVAVGILNDGNVIDVYNKKPSPPLLKLQPTIGVDVGFS